MYHICQNIAFVAIQKAKFILFFIPLRNVQYLQIKIKVTLDSKVIGLEDMAQQLLNNGSAEKVMEIPAANVGLRGLLYLHFLKQIQCIF